MQHNADGPFIRWVNYGCEGYRPESFSSLAEMFTTPCPYDFEITKRVELIVNEDGSVKASWL